jgi:hypothetical protein
MGRVFVGKTDAGAVMRPVRVLEAIRTLGCPLFRPQDGQAGDRERIEQ